MADNNQSTFISSCRTEQPEPVTVTFADGPRAVPGWIVLHYGGRKKLLADAEVLGQVTFADFISSFDEAVEREHLNKVGADVVGRHFALRIL